MLKEQKHIIEIDSKYIPRVKIENRVWKIDAEGMYYKDLNSVLRDACSKGAEKIVIRNVCGQRYIGTDLDAEVEIDVYGTPGNDMGAFMSNPHISVHGNAQDGCGNTMNAGKIVVHGQAGDLTGHSMRGGQIFVRHDVGYRVGIHMKEYKRKIPEIVILYVVMEEKNLLLFVQSYPKMMPKKWLKNYIMPSAVIPKTALWLYYLIQVPALFTFRNISGHIIRKIST